MNAVDVPEVKKIVIIGPECTGKSELSAFLASHYKTEWVPEYARGYIDNLVRPYVESDLVTIAHGQLRVEQEFGRTANRFLFCDTNLYVIKIWSEVRFGRCDDEILKEIKNRQYDLYLLTYIDIPWQDDPQREHPDKREELFRMYEREMTVQKVPFEIVRGLSDERNKNAIDAIERHFG